MKNKYVPFAVADSIYEIDIDFFKQQNVKVLLMDLDNTLDSYRAKTPTDKAKEFVNKVKSQFNVVLISNNKKEKVTSPQKILMM